MSDMTNQMASMAPARGRAQPKAEFYAYFALIFAATLPLACLTWLLIAARQMRMPEKGPISRAWSQARIITPMIFSA
ncbi:cytochrome PufQ [Palleronia sp. LCG004]|uniref:cytochrome PufQ n=1 Tax=Palleronia sp. LCG004 TaxID=3079304 RepID=UPI002943ECF5|nr:cytochrome PufQ [Palleronia sp. LCG004]WOI56116.1 cytochrome PufQ [Palleronia sp. LCG004]